MSNYVYVVFRGEKYEGGSISRIFQTYGLALAEAEHRAAVLDAAKTGFCEWWHGCDYITIEKWDTLSGCCVDFDEKSPEVLAENLSEEN